MTDVATGNAASRSTTHGGFDDDPSTMNSVAARVLNVQSVPVPYTADATRGLGDWPESVDWMRGVDVTALRTHHIQKPRRPHRRRRTPDRRRHDVACASGVVGQARRAVRRDRQISRAEYAWRLRE